MNQVGKGGISAGTARKRCLKHSTSVTRGCTSMSSQRWNMSTDSATPMRTQDIEQVDDEDFTFSDPEDENGILVCTI